MKENGKIYAMKVLNKSKVMEYTYDFWLDCRLKQYEHTIAERRIMQDISHPFLVWYCSLFSLIYSLRYAFSVSNKALSGNGLL